MDKEETKEYYKQYYQKNKGKKLNYQKQYRIENLEKIKEDQKQYRIENLKEIKEYKKQYCLDNKESINKKRNQWRKDNPKKYYESNKKYREKNKEKIREYQKQWDRNNSEKLNEKSRKRRKDNPEYIKNYYEKNKEYILMKTKKYNRDNQEKIKEYMKQYISLKRKTDIRFNLNNRINREMHKILKKNKIGRRWETLTGYSVSDLIKRLKKTMPNGYNWKDFLEGKLHIDHILPKRLFQFKNPEEKEFKQCWSLYNLRLLPAKENLIKHDNITNPILLGLLLNLK